MIVGDLASIVLSLMHTNQGKGSESPARVWEAGRFAKDFQLAI